MIGSVPTRSMAPAFILVLSLLLLALRGLAQGVLSLLNRRHVRAHAKRPPEALRDIMDEATYRRSVDYTLAKSRFGQVEELVDLAVTTWVLGSGLLPWSHGLWAGTVGSGAWAQAGWLLVVSFATSLPGMPLDWWSQFRLEERFGFNRSTLRTWLADQAKTLALGIVLGLPLLAGILRLTGWIGDRWWLWAWGLLMAFQAVLMVLAPILILPLFNKLKPLDSGELRSEIEKYCDSQGYSIGRLFVMDGSKRSTKANAFFSGLGRSKTIVLFDTLIEKLTTKEIVAVLAHEIGHYKKRHTLSMFLFSLVQSFAIFGLLGWLLSYPELSTALGAQEPSFHLSALTFFILFTPLSMLLGLINNSWSRHNEFEADTFARETYEVAPMRAALEKISTDSLANLSPHPLYVAFNYTHPTLLQRIENIEK